MKYLHDLVKKQPFTSCLIVIIWILCLMPIPEQVPLKGVPMMDKWTHFVMYGTLCLTIWIEYLKRHKKTNKKRIFLFAIIAPILMSGIIELAQAYCTGGRRSGELLDFAANSIGVGLGNAIGILLGWFRAKV